MSLRTEKEDYELILMDWNMPRMLGADALKAIRENGKTMPMIMVTTEAEKGEVVEALKSGATNHNIRPFHPDAIVGKIKEALGM